MMKTTIEEIDGKYVATLVGEMDTPSAVKAEEVLKPLYNSNGKDAHELSMNSMRSKLYRQLHGNYMLKIKHELSINSMRINYMVNYMAITC